MKQNVYRNCGERNYEVARLTCRKQRDRQFVIEVGCMVSFAVALVIESDAALVEQSGSHGLSLKSLSQRAGDVSYEVRVSPA